MRSILRSIAVLGATATGFALTPGLANATPPSGVSGTVLTTISLVCAVFSPVWADWRESERRLPEAPDSLTQ